MPPKRIISLVPSQTELLFDLGLDEAIVGITKFCIYPVTKVRNKAIVGGTKTLDLNKIKSLCPDLIIANKEENTREEIEELQSQYVVHVTDVASLPDALAMIREVGALVGKSAEAKQLTRAIELTLFSLPPVPRPSVAYFIWRKPYMVAANATFIHAMLEVAGFQSVFADRTRYPEITANDLKVAQPDLIFLSSEPYPFAEKHVAEVQVICPSAYVVVVDGELFSWYGSRLLRSSDYFRNLRNEIARHSS
ncbi:helical backbone metal receptor [Spirosoma jeollabukense]